jgi:thioredoxin-dependent peroxiredoxin
MANTKKSPVKTARKAPAAAAKPGANGVILEGKKAPAFNLPDQSGEKVSLRDLTARGNVVIYFYPKDMTPGCTTEACSFRDNIAEVKKLDAQIVGISADSPASHQKFIDKYSLNFPLLSDADKGVCTAYGVYKMKSLYGREYMGIERTTVVIDRDGIVRKIFPKVKVNGHTEEVIEALKELE